MYRRIDFRESEAYQAPSQGLGHDEQIQEGRSGLLLGTRKEGVDSGGKGDQGGNLLGEFVERFGSVA
jgi:hypothetical protein